MRDSSADASSVSHVLATIGQKHQAYYNTGSEHDEKREQNRIT